MTYVAVSYLNYMNLKTDKYKFKHISKQYQNNIENPSENKKLFDLVKKSNYTSYDDLIESQCNNNNNTIQTCFFKDLIETTPINHFSKYF